MFHGGQGSETQAGTWAGCLWFSPSGVHGFTDRSQSHGTLEVPSKSPKQSPRHIVHFLSKLNSRPFPRNMGVM
jgi:hypothetical protein